MKKEAKKHTQGGITLIALVITIIVLLILAGITINLTLGENGILIKADEAAKNTDIVDTKEKIKLELMGMYNKETLNYTNQDVIVAIEKVTGNTVEEKVSTVKSKKGNEVDVSDLWQNRITFTINSGHFNALDIPFEVKEGITWKEWLLQPETKSILEEADHAKEYPVSYMMGEALRTAPNADNSDAIWRPMGSNGAPYLRDALGNDVCFGDEIRAEAYSFKD